MEQKKKAPAKKPAVVKRPYLTGKPMDGTVVKSALLVFAGMAATGIVFLLLAVALSMGNTFLRVVLNALVMLVTYALFFYSGMSTGTSAVNQGEIMYRRQETGREILPEERARCYHPLKGFVIGFLGALPFVICAVILALTASRQMYSVGSLPSWVTALTADREVSQPLALYTTPPAMTVEAAMRVLVRMLVMPVVNIVTTNDPDGLLMMERFSWLLVLLPGIAYGIGYTRGTEVRTRVHTDIAANRRKKARKARKERERAHASRGPQQLN